MLGEQQSKPIHSSKQQEAFLKMTPPTSTPLRAALKTEFAVNMTCDSCIQKVETALSSIPNVTKHTTSLPTKSVTIESTTPPSILLRVLKSTGLATVLKGQSTVTGEHLGAAVCIFESFRGARGWAQNNNRGLARLVQVDESTCLVDVTVHGMQEGEHSVKIHECGDISGGSDTVGAALHDLGNIAVDKSGSGDLVVEHDGFKLWEVLGRSIVMEKLRKLEGERDDSDRVCGIIARSAGVFENPKSVCSCSGETLWEESRSRI
ncbi:superoxide dismutase [Phlyctochytrium arcticum]|nr:superoxide dismutase [Phlyctochytrium arcticum]